MACYVSTILTGSEYCTLHLQRQIDDYIIRRMIKCSSSLGCYMQAAILCQVSYRVSALLAFRLSQIWFIHIYLSSTYIFCFIFSFWRISTTVWRSKRLPIEQHLKQLPKSRPTSRTQWIRITIVFGTQLYLNLSSTCRAKRESTSVNSRRWVFEHAWPMARNGHICINKDFHFRLQHWDSSNWMPTTTRKWNVKLFPSDGRDSCAALLNNISYNLAIVNTNHFLFTIFIITWIEIIINKNKWKKQKKRVVFCLCSWYVFIS